MPIEVDDVLAKEVAAACARRATRVRDVAVFQAAIEKVIAEVRSVEGAGEVNHAKLVTILRQLEKAVHHPDGSTQ